MAKFVESDKSFFIYTAVEEADKTLEWLLRTPYEQECVR
jgi:hypothetical protein